MATLLDDDLDQAQQILDAAAAELAMSRALDHARSLRPRAALACLAGYSRQIAATEAEILADQIGDDGDTRHARNLLDDGKTSGKQRRQKADRAKAVGHNPDLGNKLGANDLSEEQLDAIAEAANKTDGEAAHDNELIGDVSKATPEQAKSIVADYLAARSTADSVQNEHNRQRALRRASTFTSKKHGLATICIEGDSVAINSMWDSITRRHDLLYRRDGGRDLPLTKHPRTNDQRKFDAAHELLCDTTVDPSGQTRPTEPDSSHDTCEPRPAPDAAPGGGGGSGKPNSRVSGRHTPPKGPAPKPSASARPSIVISLTIDHFLGLDPTAVATQHGLGLIPQSVLADYAEHADIMAALYDRNGKPLWLGRLERYATTTQYIALVLRDRHCVLCGAPHTRCQAHHIMPWTAPGQGPTDLDNLVLLCHHCHRHVHADRRTLYRKPDRHWATRPATPNELAPPRPAPRNRPQPE